MCYIKQLRIIGFKKFKDLTVTFNPNKNIIIGENEAGKSTILEALNIVLNQQYRNSDKSILHDLMNKDNIKNFEDDPSFENLPSIKIEVIFELDSTDLKSSEFHGENSLNPKETSYGILFKCEFNKDLFPDNILSNTIKEIPYEYYEMSWSTFQGKKYSILKQPLKSILIDTSSIDTNNTFNYFNKTIFHSRYSLQEQIHAKNSFRANLSLLFKELSLPKLNNNRTFDINYKKIILENIISILENDIPLENKGSGMENLIKTQIALDKSNSKLDVIMIEEPENHLCYTNLQQMLSTINSYSKDSQLIITTHNSMIASRLDLRNILWIETNTNQTSKLDNIDEETAQFFIKLDNNNLLHLLLSKKAILVEGPTEYLLLPYFYKKIYKRTLAQDGITLITCGGISYKRYFDITKNTNIKIAVITDNDEKDTNLSYMKEHNSQSISQKIFMDNDLKNFTWEVALYNCNEQNPDLEKCAGKIDPTADYKFNKVIYGKNGENKPILGKMLNNKVDVAYKILQYEADLQVPKYVKEAFKWINE